MKTKNWKQSYVVPNRLLSYGSHHFWVMSHGNHSSKQPLIYYYWFESWCAICTIVSIAHAQPLHFFSFGSPLLHLLLGSPLLHHSIKILSIWVWWWWLSLVVATLGLSSLSPLVWVCVVEISGFVGLCGYGFVEVLALVVHRGSSTTSLN